MKISKSQLQKIIAEEVREHVKKKLMKENKKTQRTVKATPSILKHIIAEEVSKAKSNRLFEAKDLKALANSSDVDNRCKAARDPELPDDLVSMLADDPEKKVRDCISKRKNLPQAIQKKLKKPDLQESRNLVRATPGMLKRIIAEEVRLVREAADHDMEMSPEDREDLDRGRFMRDEAEVGGYDMSPENLEVLNRALDVLDASPDMGPSERKALEDIKRIVNPDAYPDYDAHQEDVEDYY